MTIKQINPVSCGKVIGLIYAVLGFLGVLLMALWMLFRPGELHLLWFEIPFSVLGLAGAFVGLPLLYGVGGFVMGLIVAVLYNVVAPRVGGIEIELE